MKNNIKKVVTAGLVGFIVGTTLTVSAGTWIQAYRNDELKVSLDGKIQTFRDATTNEIEVPITYNDRTYLPLRSLATLVGLNVDYDAATKTAKLETPEYTKTNNVKIGSNKIYLGEWNESVYTNESMDIKYVLPNDWEKMGEEREEELENFATENLNFEASSKDDINNYYKHLFVQSTSNNNNVQVITDKCTIDVTAEEYIELLKNDFANQDAIKYEIGKVTNQLIGNYEYVALNLYGSFGSIPDYKFQQKIYARKQGEYIIAMIATSNTGENGFDEIISCFK